MSDYANFLGFIMHKPIPKEASALITQDLIGAAVTSGTPHMVHIPVLLQSCLGLLLPLLALHLLAGLVGVPIHIALATPHVLAGIANQRWAAVILCRQRTAC